MKGHASSTEGLCCCEYENNQGEKSHILACCCDCEAFDQAADRCITCRQVPPETMERLFKTIEDRCRVPGILGQGAIKLRLDVIVPVITIPVCLFLATIGPVMTAVMLTMMPIFLLWFYRMWKRNTKKDRTLFFYSWGLMSVVTIFVVFESCVVGFREILLWEHLLLLTAMFLMLYNFVRTKLNTPYLKNLKRPRNFEKMNQSDRRIVNADDTFKVPMSLEEMTAVELPESDVKWLDSRPITDGKLVTWCQHCNLNKPPRSGHCNLCKVCVSVRDHHCVWIDTCIGADNHRSFIISMMLFVFCGYYGCHLSMTTLCTPKMYFDWFLFPNDCRFLYIDFQTSASFVGTCYTFLASTIMLFGLIFQFLLISQNLTSQEFHIASQRNMLRHGLFATKNVYNQGFIHNWFNFWLTGRKDTRTSVITL
ncbi:palmitoyltransferase ZDHHC23-like [Saccostrea echinata]|uniref:palmitoyltransferase ZDHHC23-like n=1 Tax=Saccostrea echinata TaxID=191078 RepID=UPI002A823A6E|nr:palmitoyltransferase ZDHHC23-like [Saccostrea echinata]XP_061184158.1 palmitoyltransferase ZDHHC23-like [Saccostrea echinata]